MLLESWMDLSDNVEKELLYFQVLYTLRADKFPVKQVEAVSDSCVMHLYHYHKQKTFKKYSSVAGCENKKSPALNENISYFYFDT